MKYLPIVLLLAACSGDPIPVTEDNPEVIIEPPIYNIEPIIQQLPSGPEVIDNFTLPPEEIYIMAPVKPLVFYTVEEKWYQIDPLVKRPVPSIEVTARVTFDPTGADNYNVVKDEAVIAMMSETSDPHTFTFVQPGMAATHDKSTFPRIQIQAQTGDTTAVSQDAEWVME